MGANITPTSVCRIKWNNVCRALGTGYTHENYNSPIILIINGELTAWIEQNYRYFLVDQIAGWLNTEVLKAASVQLSSVSQSCPTLCDPMDCSTPGFSVHHQLLEFTQSHVHWVSDALQPCHPLSSPSAPAFNLSQHQGLFKWISSSHQVAKVL